MSKITIVDDNDNVIGDKERSEITSSDIYRVAGLWITNSKGEILLAQRKLTKNNYPGRWSPAAAGTVEENESYEQNIRREAEEELEIKDVKFTISEKLKITGKHSYFAQLFSAKLDWPVEKFKPLEEEIEQIKWYKRSEIEQMLKDNPEVFTPTIREMLDAIQ